MNGDDEDFEKMKTNMQARRLAAKQAKKSKKRPAASAEASDMATKEKKISKSDKKPDQNGAASSKVKSKQDKSKPKSVQKDPKASEAYKSLFTSCDEAKKQGAQHSGWVSFNPQYFR